MRPVRDRDDLLRAARSVAEHFQTDCVIVVGSQAILLKWPDAPMGLKITPEIDLYPANNREWEARNPGFEASEEISELFGEMSAFHQRFGFYLDGVDENTAQMSPDWMKRAATAEIDVYGRTVVIVCPAIQDVVVSKLRRLTEKDLDFIRECVAGGRIEVGSVLAGLRATKPDPAILSRAQSLLEGMGKRRTLLEPHLCQRRSVPDWTRPSPCAARHNFQARASSANRPARVRPQLRSSSTAGVDVVLG